MNQVFNDKKNILLKLNDSLAAAVINKAIVIKIWKRIKKTDKTNNKKAGLIVAIVNDDKRLAKKLIQKLIAIKEAMLFIAPIKASKTNCQNFFSNKRQVSRNSFQEALIIECFCKTKMFFITHSFLYYAFFVLCVYCSKEPINRQKYCQKYLTINKTRR